MFLHRAAEEGRLDVIEALLRWGADVEERDSDGGWTPLMLAAGAPVVEALLRAGADVHATMAPEWELQYQALHWQAYAGDAAAVEALLRAGADVHAPDCYGRQPLHHATHRKDCDAAVVEALVRAGADVRALDEDRQQPLHHAAKYGNAPAVEALLRAGADARAADVDGNTPLHLAAMAPECDDRDASPAAIEALLRAGADVEALDEDGKTPLFHAANHGEPAAITALLRAGARDWCGDHFRGAWSAMGPVWEQAPEHLDQVVAHMHPAHLARVRAALCCLTFKRSPLPFLPQALYVSIFGMACSPYA